jgi:lipoate-protein ligase A
MFRLIPFQEYEPNLRLALNKIAIESVVNGGDPIISLSGWKPSCINIGYTQKIKQVLDLEEIKKQNIQIVRRESAGGAMYLGEKSDICWGIIANSEYFGTDITKIYQDTSKKIISALNEMNISAKHKPINDVILENGNGKISGSAIKQIKNITYIHGTLLYKLNKKILNKILKPENDHQKKIKIKEIDKNLSSISEQSTVSYKNTIKILENNLTNNENYYIKPWTTEELEKAKELEKKYSSSEWINKF